MHKPSFLRKCYSKRREGLFVQTFYKICLILMIRFGKFTGSSYKWSWKGGALRGRSIPDYRKVYAIPTKFVPTLGQNEGY